MARSVEGIPVDFLFAYAKDDFIAWLRHMPIPPPARRAIIKAWSNHTLIPFTQADHIAVTPSFIGQ